MSRLIDVSGFTIQIISPAVMFDTGYDKGFRDGVKTVMKKLKHIPESVVRCEQCRYYRKYDDGNYGCDHFYMTTDPDFYCADGRRKNDEHIHNPD